MTCLFCLQAQKLRTQKKDIDYYVASKSALARGDVALAIGLGEEGVKKEPNNMDLHNLLGKAYLQGGYLDKARTKLLYVIKIQPSNWDAKRHIVNVEFEAKHYSAALSHINEFLDHAPFDAEMWNKKISIYETIGQKHEAERLVSRLYAIFPQDSNAKRLNAYYATNRLNEALRSGNLGKAKEELENVLKSDPKNYELQVQLINTILKSGDKEQALKATENALTHFPDNKYFISKKLGLLEDTKKYTEAVAYAELIQKNYRGVSYKPYINNLKFQIARQARKNESYSLYQELLAGSPGNDEAQSFLINESLNKGMYEEAGRLIDKALKSRPNNTDLLQKKFRTLQALNKDGQAYALAEKMYNGNRGNEDLREQYITLAIKNAKDLVVSQQWTSAEELLKKLSSYTSLQPMVNEYLFTVYSQQRKDALAISTINSLIRSNPKNENYKLKKIGFLEQNGDLSAALEATKQLPRGARFTETYNSIAAPIIKQMIEQEKYDSALAMTDKLIMTNPKNYLAYQYAMNICDAMNRYESGVGYADVALDIFPNSKETKLKRIGFLQALKRYDESTLALDLLQKEYPNSEKIKNNLLEDRAAYARDYLKKNDKESALNLYKQNMELNPLDTTTMYKTINIYIDENKPDSAITYINKGLNANPDDKHLIMKKAVAYEIKKQFDSSYFYANQLIPKASQQDYADYLFSKTLKHQAGIIYLRTTFDTIQNGNSLASFQYTRFYPFNTYTYRMNFAARNNGTALQHELDWYHKLNTKRYTQANVAIANKVMFPYLKLAGSIFTALKKDYESEFGFKYLQLKAFATFSGIAGISKTYNDIWLNARGFVMFDGKSFYNAGRLTSRFYMNNRSEYFSVLAGYGTSPDDRSLDFILNKFIGIVTRYVGAGYQKELRYRTTLGITGTWNNIRVQESTFSNQYNLFLTALRKF
jgi:cellulose synthase operon protein C